MGIDGVALVGATLVGLCVGSFLNVCIARLPNEDPKDRSLLRPPSTCPRCGKRIAWYDNIPVASWLLLRARCRRCHQPISIQYPIVELVVGGLWLAAFARYGVGLEALEAALFGTVLLGIAVIDGRHQIIPHELNFGGLAVGLGLSLRDGAPGFLASLLGAAAGLGILWTVRIVGGWVFKEEAMGLGDVFMLAMVGSFVRWDGVLLTLFAGSLFGTLVYIPLVLLQRKRIVPFGVYLAMGAAVTFVYKAPMEQWYFAFVHGG